MDEYTKSALQEDLVGPAGSNLTPLAVIDADMLQSEVRSLCVVFEKVCFYFFVLFFINSIVIIIFS